MLYFLKLSKYVIKIFSKVIKISLDVFIFSKFGSKFGFYSKFSSKANLVANLVAKQSHVDLFESIMQDFLG